MIRVVRLNKGQRVLKNRKPLGGELGFQMSMKVQGYFCFYLVRRGNITPDVGH